MKTKSCKICNQENSLMHRDKVDETKNWYFACKSCTEMKLKKINTNDMVVLGKISRFFMMPKAFHLVFLCVALCFLGCNKNKDYTQIDEEIIQEYIADNNLDAVATGSGLYYVIETTGNGVFPDLSSVVTVAYTGKLTDGSVFDQSSSAGISFPLTNVIQGWQEGIPLFSEGGTGKLLIPSALGYGNNAIGSIPANSVLIFDIELLDVD